MGLTLCSPELRHRTPRIPFLIDERPHRECHPPKCLFPSIATRSYGWCISGSLSPHRDSWACRINSRGSQALLAGFCRTPLPGLGLYAEPVEFSQPLSGSDMIDPPWRQGGGPMSNGCGVSGYAVGKGVSVTRTDGDTHLQRLSFSRTRSLSVVPTPVCGRARHCRPQQLRRVRSSSRGLERRRIHSTLSPHTTSNRPAEAFKHCKFAHPPRGRGPVSDPTSYMAISHDDRSSGLPVSQPRNKQPLSSRWEDE